MALREIMIELGVIFDIRQLTLWGRYSDRAKTQAQLARKAFVGLAGAVALAGGAIGAYVGQQSLLIANSARQASAFMMTTQAFMGLEYAFSVLGATTDDLQDALGTLVDRAKDAMEGSKEYAKEFKRVGIAISELRGKKPGELFDLYIKRAGQVKDKTDAIASAVRLFGDDLGRRILPALVGGAVSIDKLRKAAQEAGYILSDTAVKAMNEAASAARMMRLHVIGLSRQMAANMAPAFKDAADAAVNVVRYFNQVGQTLSAIVSRHIREDIKKLVLLWHDFDAAVARAGGWTVWLQRLARVMALLATIGLGGGIYSLVKAINTLLVALSASSIPMLLTWGLVFAAIGAAALLVFLVIEDLFTMMKGGDSIIGRLIQRNDWLGKTIKVLAIELIKVWNLLKQTWQAADEVAKSFGITNGAAEVVVGILVILGMALAGVAGILVVGVIGAFVFFGAALKGLWIVLQDVRWGVDEFRMALNDLFTLDFDSFLARLGKMSERLGAILDIMNPLAGVLGRFNNAARGIEKLEVTKPAAVDALTGGQPQQMSEDAQATLAALERVRKARADYKVPSKRGMHVLPTLDPAQYLHPQAHTMQNDRPAGVPSPFGYRVPERGEWTAMQPGAAGADPLSKALQNNTVNVYMQPSGDPRTDGRRAGDAASEVLKNQAPYAAGRK